MSINWYPGHMKKTESLLKEQLQLVDLVLELLDARIPYSSSNPKLANLLQHKKRIVVLNKVDLADEYMNKQWQAYFQQQGLEVIQVNATRSGINRLVQESVDKVFKEKAAQLKARGRNSRPARVMVVGIPNVGKSTLINQLAGKGSAKTGDKPGVTRGKQWIRVHDRIELLDTPGILWPKFEDAATGIRLAQTGAIRDEIVDQQELAWNLLQTLQIHYPLLLEARYGGDVTQPLTDYIDSIGQARGCLLKAGEIDYQRIARILLEEFRSGKLGRITLEKPSDEVTA
ncbi:ribosome biogenesis GTPase YlqF [Anoxynatronum buryatiense]|uniref:Ribosome biogenesis GTPase A n=1 Tax=Anoxynatronum buryatiense TaxID=489973 RepID=A0AA46AI76_9CLOT|nr:ribosome biogenesis GTPase YlqF [Anoxynatronum buryatiense]SMP47119.1 ribosome biogenesis GTPase A [Anoxynatronum buryatiense]